MKVKFGCDSGANIHSCREEVLDLKEDLGIDPVDWTAMSDEAKQKVVDAWAWDRLEIWWQPAEDDDED